MSGIITDNVGRGSGLVKAAGGGGKVLQAFYASSANQYYTATNGTSTSDVTDLTQVITPSSSSNKILLIWTHFIHIARCDLISASSFVCDFRRAITGGATTDDLMATAAGSQQYSHQYDGRSTGDLPKYYKPVVTKQLLDDPQTTSEITYTCMFGKYSWGAPTDDGESGVESGHLTTMEIEG